MNKDIKQHIITALKKGVRFDGRKLDEFRPIEIEYGVSKTAEGSALVRLGDTIVMAGVKLGIEKPFPDTPEDGILMVGAEFYQMASPDFEGGPPGDDSIELARVIDRGIRESRAVHLDKLCLEKGEKVWSISVDLCMMNSAGNLIDASGIAALAALRDTRFPTMEDDKIDYSKKTNKKLPLEFSPLPVTIFKIGDSFLVDPSEEEEKASDARLTVTTTEKGTICALQKGGEAPLTAKEIEDAIELAIIKSNEIRKKLKV